MNILGISAYFHDSAAALIRDGEIIAAAQEERFSRVKFDPRLPIHAIEYCLRQGGVRPSELDCVAYYEKPLTSFHRVLATFLSIAPRGLGSFVQAMTLWGRQKLWIPYEIEKGLRRLGCKPSEAVFAEHHESHAASAFYPSPFESAAIVTADAVGEWATSTIGVGSGHQIELIKEMRFPHSVGLLYSAFTSFCGFRVNADEYKLMGLAPYGDPVFVQRIKDELVRIFPDGSIELNLAHLTFSDPSRMTTRSFDDLFGGPGRSPGDEITTREMDLARSIQVVTEEIMLAMVRHAHAITGERRLCLAGGVALNAVANGRILREGPFDELWVQPAAGDAGGAIGAALAAWHGHYGEVRVVDGTHDGMKSGSLGPEFCDEEVQAFLGSAGVRFSVLDDQHRAKRVAHLLAEGKVVGILSGRMEFGPRALGFRSILADPRPVDMQSTLNRKIKFRESFRPFAPAILEERVGALFDVDAPSPYMLLVAPLKDEHRRPVEDSTSEDLEKRLQRARSIVPAVTHVDHSARLQTVSGEQNPELHSILSEFESLTGCPMLINTSMNVSDEPIVCTPAEAYECFVSTEMDALLLERCLVEKHPEELLRGDGW